MTRNQKNKKPSCR